MASKTHPYQKWDEETELRAAKRKKESKTAKEKWHVHARRGVEDHLMRVALKHDQNFEIDLIEEI